MAEVKPKVDGGPYFGWAQVTQSNEKGEIFSATFPLNEIKTFTIGVSIKNDFELSPELDKVNVSVSVDKDGKVAVENQSSSASDEKVLINDKELGLKEKAELVDKSKIKIGPFVFAYKRIDPPGTSQLRVLLSSLQCAVCLRFLDNPKSLNCTHVFCQSCLSGLMAASNANRGPDNVVVASCPVCRKPVSNEELNSNRREKALTDVSKQFQEVIEGRPLCSDCSNQRWIMHYTDYNQCETCSKLLCPMCALDFHRDHKLRSVYHSMLQSSRSFINKTTQTKLELKELRKTIEEHKQQVCMITNWLDELHTSIDSSKDQIEQSFKPIMVAYSNVESLESPKPNDGGKTEQLRNESLKLFEANISEAQKRIQTIKRATDVKIALLVQTQAKFAEVGQQGAKSA